MRDPVQALAWVENLTGGQILAKSEHFRWRPQWFLDVQTADGEIKKLLLRGWRTPGIADSEQGSRQRLRREADILAVLNTLPVKAPKYYGYEANGDWMLMERVAGDDLLTEVTAPARQTNLFKQYIGDMARLHEIDPATMNLPETIRRPKDFESNATSVIETNRAAYRAAKSGLDPLLEFAWWWLAHRRPTPVAQYSLCTGDIGANQFMFQGDQYVAMFDVEMGYVGDPIQDIGLMRYRNICYPAAGFESVLQHYYACRGLPIDKNSLNYWSVAGFIGVSPIFASLLETPDPAIPIDMTLVRAMHTRRRGLMEVFHQIYGLPLPALPARPVPAANPYEAFHAYTGDAISAYFMHEADAKAAHHLRFIKAHSETARLCAAIGAEITQMNINDLATVLGRRPDNEKNGLALLTTAIMAAPEKDIAARLGALYQISARTEYLLEPCIHAAGLASFAPVDLLGA